MGPHLGIGAIARTPFARGTVLSEYVGEVIPYDPCSTPPPDNRYTFDIMGNSAEPLACIDALHVGSWTRFINHSCKPNAEYVLKRVGREARVCVEVIREIGVGGEIKVGYGSAYWKTMEELGMWCGCGEKGCRFGEKKGRGKER
jgi:SET domain-containing protein